MRHEPIPATPTRAEVLLMEIEHIQARGILTAADHRRIDSKLMEAARLLQSAPELDKDASHWHMVAKAYQAEAWKFRSQYYTALIVSSCFAPFAAYYLMQTLGIKW